MIHLSDAAADQITKLLTEPFDIGLRIEVVAGGCSGYQYKFSKVSIAGEEDDTLIKGKLYIDPTSAEILKGSTIDYESSLMKQEFVVINPNSACCGCGKSFT